MVAQDCECNSVIICSHWFMHYATSSMSLVYETELCGEKGAQGTSAITMERPLVRYPTRVREVSKQQQTASGNEYL